MRAPAGTAGVLARLVNSILCFATLTSPFQLRTWKKAAKGRAMVCGCLSGGKLKSRMMSLKSGFSSVSKMIRESPPDGSRQKECVGVGPSGVAAGGLGSKPRPSSASFGSWANAVARARQAIPAAITAITHDLGTAYPLLPAMITPEIDENFRQGKANWSRRMI